MMKNLAKLLVLSAAMIALVGCDSLQDAAQSAAGSLGVQQQEQPEAIEASLGVSNEVQAAPKAEEQPAEEGGSDPSAR